MHVHSFEQIWNQFGMWYHCTLQMVVMRACHPNAIANKWQAPSGNLELEASNHSMRTDYGTREGALVIHIV